MVSKAVAGTSASSESTERWLHARHHAIGGLVAFPLPYPAGPGTRCWRAEVSISNQKDALWLSSVRFGWVNAYGGHGSAVPARRRWSASWRRRVSASVWGTTWRAGQRVAAPGRWGRAASSQQRAAAGLGQGLGVVLPQRRLLGHSCPPPAHRCARMVSECHSGCSLTSLGQPVLVRTIIAGIHDALISVMMESKVVVTMLTD